MSGLEIALLIIGIAIAIASFIFSSKLDGPQTAPANNAELTERQRAAIEKQIVDIFEEKMEELSAKQESQMDMISVTKKKEMDEYSDTILNEINRNHNEVMFLYDMLNEKKKEITNAVRDANMARTSMESVIANAEPVEEKLAEMPQKAPKKASTTKTTKKKTTTVLEPLDTPVEPATDVVFDEEKIVKPKRVTKSTAKTAASRAKAAIAKETSREENRSVGSLETGNNNEMILELNRQGKTNVEIAKQLGIGIGEVKLVIDLFKGGR